MSSTATSLDRPDSPDRPFASRRSSLASSLLQHECDGFLTLHPAHVLWLSGFHGSNGGLLVAAQPCPDSSGLDIEQEQPASLISTDSRYTTQVGLQAPDVELVPARDCGSALAGRAQALGIRRLGIESELLSVSELRALESALPRGVELVETSGVVAALRLCKSKAELSALREVAQISSAAFQSLIEDDWIRPGVTERRVAAELEYRMRIRGADRPSFDTIVASGPNSAKPHHGAENRMLADGDLVTIDFGAYAFGYNSDTTRTVFVGGAEAAEAKAREIFNVVHCAHAAGIAMAKAGTALRDVDKACRDIIELAGYGEYFVHSTGHGVGIDVHEAPLASRNGTGILAAGMTLTIEPGIYVPDFGGVRIEDTLIITESEPEIITNLPNPRA